MIPGAANGNPAPVAPTALINDRRETVIGKCFSWLSLCFLEPDNPHLRPSRWRLQGFWQDEIQQQIMRVLS